MEFGIVIQGYVPRRRGRNTHDAEHDALMNELALVQAAERAGFKYAWVSEHHFLDQYSHLSAPDVVIGYLAHATSRIHLGSAILNPLPQLCHPVVVAERAAMLDHLSEGRIELGTRSVPTGREVSAFGMSDPGMAAKVWDEAIGQFARMWEDGEYSYSGRWFSLPPRTVLPKPWRRPHPPLWMAASDVRTYAKAARLGLGVLDLDSGTVAATEPMIKAYRAAMGEAEPVGAYANHNVMVATYALCLTDGREARRIARRMGLNYLRSLYHRYHDTVPRPEGVPRWPAVAEEPDAAEIERRIEAGELVCGDPDEVLQQVRRYAVAGADQLTFRLPLEMPAEAAYETLRLIGRHIIPAVDGDPVHRTNRLRAAAAGR